MRHKPHNFPHRIKGNALMVANYPSDTAYAWWLMEHFWTLITEMYTASGNRAFLAFPRINTPPSITQKTAVEALELTFPWNDKIEKMAFIEFIKQNKIELIYLTDQHYFDVRYKTLRDAGIKHIIVHDHTPGDRPPFLGIRGALKDIRNRISPFTADAVFCISPLMRERSISNGRIPSSKCIIVQNGIPPHKSSMTRAHVRKSLGIDNDTVVAITTGRVAPYKRLDFIIKAASLQDESAGIIYMIVGDGPAFCELDALVEKLDVAKSVKLLGFRTDVSELLRASDFAIHAAQGEGFSLSITEYMGAGLPVLVPNIPSVSQAIEHGRNGYIYAKDSHEELASYALMLAEKSELRRSMGENAKHDALTKYSLEQCTKAFASSMETVLSKC